MEYKRVLVICIDRDADVTTKIGEEGPIYGKESVLSVATRLGLADPIETDTNALFESIRIYDKYKNEGVSSEVVAVLGDPELGLKSDTKLSHQIDEAIKKYRPDGAVLVSDGAEDDHILPIVESRIKIISVRRVIVKQNEKLESTYYLLQDFLKDIVKDPKLARLFIGAPGVAAVLYMLLGENGWRLIVGIVGVFLLIKGFSLENLFEKGTKELRASFATGRISFFTYGVSLLIAILGIVVGYEIGRQLSIETIFAERSEGKFNLRRGFEIPKNSNVLVVEDVITTGKSALECSKLIKDSKANLAGYSCIIDRSNKNSKIKEKIISQVKLKIDTFKNTDLPEKLKKIKPIEPGSRNLSKWESKD